MVFFNCMNNLFSKNYEKNIQYKVQNFNINLHCYSFTGSCKTHKLLIPRTHPYLKMHVPSAKMQRKQQMYPQAPHLLTELMNDIGVLKQTSYFPSIKWLKRPAKQISLRLSHFNMLLSEEKVAVTSHSVELSMCK